MNSDGIAVQEAPEARLAKFIEAGLKTPDVKHSLYAFGVSRQKGNVCANTNGFALIGAVGLESALQICEEALERVGEENEDEEPHLQVPSAFLEQIVVLEFSGMGPAEIWGRLKDGRLKITAGSYVRITSTPDGEAPEEIRKLWIGCIMPAEKTLDPLAGVMSGRLAEHRGGFSVKWDDAMNELKMHHPEAEEWWRTNVPQFRHLIFTPECCEVLAA